MKNVFIGLIKVVLALTIIFSITWVFVGINYILFFMFDYFQNTSYGIDFNAEDSFIKWLIAVCFVEALISKMSKIKINKQPKGVYRLLAKWRKERNIKHSDYYVYCGNIVEELLEPIYEKETIKTIKQEILNRYFIETLKLDDNKVIDAICDIQVFSINEIGTMKYDNKKCMLETIKEIDSRVQDPKQADEWQNFGANGKWMKWAEQPLYTLYVANYSSCKVK